MALSAHRRHRAQWRRVLASLVTGAALAALAVAAGASALSLSRQTEPDQGPTARSAGVAGPAATLPGPAGKWERVLQQLDRRRARAFALGDPRALATVYERGSAVLAADRAAVAAYTARGLTVEGATFRLLDLRSRRLAAGEVVLRVVDRLGPARARTRGGAGVRLPHDRPTVHRLRLDRGAGGWRISAVDARTG